MYNDNVSDEVKMVRKGSYIKKTLPYYLKKLDAVAGENAGCSQKGTG